MAFQIQYILRALRRLGHCNTAISALGRAALVPWWMVNKVRWCQLAGCSELRMGAEASTWPGAHPGSFLLASFCFPLTLWFKEFSGHRLSPSD